MLHRWLATLVITLALSIITVRAQPDTPPITSPDEAHLTLPALTGVAYGFAWSPDSTRFLRWQIMPIEYEAAVFDAASGEILFNLPIAEDMAWSRSGQTVIGDRGMGVGVWDAETGAELAMLDGRFPHLLGDGTRVAVSRVSSDTPYHLYVYEAETGELLQSIEGRWLAASSDGGRVVLGADGRISVYALGTDEAIYSIEHDFLAAPTRFSPDGEFLALWVDGRWAFHNVDRGEVAFSTVSPAVEGGRGCGAAGSGEFAPVWSADGALVVTHDVDGMTIRNRQGEVVAPLKDAAGQPVPPQRVVFSPDGTRLLTLRGRGGIYDAQTGLLTVDLGVLGQAMWSPTGEHILTWGADYASLWDAQTGDYVLHVPHHLTLSACSRSYLPPTFSPDGKKLITSDDLTYTDERSSPPLTDRAVTWVWDVP